MDRQRQARAAIECEFRETVDRDVELIAEQVCQERGRDDAMRRCRHSDDLISDMIWARFGSFDWTEVEFVYDGTYGHSSRYLWAKVDLTVTWACAAGVCTPDVEAALQQAVVRLRCLWTEWAGWKATTTDDLAVAVASD